MCLSMELLYIYYTTIDVFYVFLFNWSTIYAVMPESLKIYIFVKNIGYLIKYESILLIIDLFGK